MKKLYLIAALAVGIAPMAHSAAITYVGGAGSSIDDGASWSGGVVPANGVDSGTITDTAVTFTSRALYGALGMDITFAGSSSLANSQTAAVRIGGASWTFNGSSSFDVTGSTTAETLILGYNGPITLNWNSSGSLSGTPRLDFGRGGNVATVNQTAGAIVVDGALNLVNAVYTISGGTLSCDDVTWTAGTIDFAAGGNGIITATSGATDFAAMVVAGQITFDGAAADVSNFIITSTTIEAISAVTTSFTDGLANGIWNNAGNWSDGVPVAETIAAVNGGLTANLSTASGNALSIKVGDEEGESGTITNGSLTVAEGTQIGIAPNATGTVNLTAYTAGTAGPSGVTIGTGENASGILIASSGSIDGSSLSVGTGPGASGWLDLGIGGTLDFNSSVIIAGSTSATGLVTAATFTLTGNQNLTVGNDTDTHGRLIAGGASIDSGILSLATGSNAVGTINIGTGTLTSSAGVQMGTGQDALATLEATSLTLTAGADLNVASGQDSTANFNLTNPMVLASTNGIFVGTGVGSTHNLTAADFAITGPIGDFTMGAGTGSSIESLMSSHNSFGAIRADSALNIIGGDHQITALTKNAAITFGGTATYNLFTNTAYSVSSLDGVTASMNLADLDSGTITVGTLTVASGDNATGSLTYTGGDLDLIGAVNVGNGASSDAELLLNSMTSIATNNSLSICEGGSGSTGTVTIAGSALVQSLRVGGAANSRPTLTVDSISGYQYLIVGRGSNSTAVISANTFNRPVELGLQLGEGQDSYASITADNGTVAAGANNSVNISSGIGSESIFALTNGTLTVGAGRGFNVATGSNSVATVYVGTIDVPGLADVNIATGPNAVATVTTFGGTITAQDLNLGDGGVLALAGGSLAVTGAVNAVDGYINTLDADSTFTWGGKGEADFIALWDAGTLRSNGESGLTGATFSNYYVVNGSDLSIVPVSSISISTVPGGVAISWFAIAGLSYDIEYKNNLVTDPNWLVETNVTGVAGPMSVTVPTTESERFYQVTAP